MRTWLPAIVLGLLSSSASPGSDACDAIPIWQDGHREGAVCRAVAATRGLTVVELDDDWVPPILAGGGEVGGPSYRATYQALARERFADAGPDGELAARDRYLELFGIEPTLGVIRGRLADEIGHRCHAAIDDTALEAVSGRIVEEPRRAAFARLADAAALRAALEHDRRHAQLPDLAALAARDPSVRRRVERLRLAETHLAAVRAAQAHLACDWLYGFPPVDAAYTWPTRQAVAAFQRSVLILPTGVLDQATREALALDSRERTFRAALRVLRARVIAATGLIEDGTAGSGPGTVLARTLDPEATWRVAGHEPLDGAAPDLVSAATEAAARALGWRDATSTLAFLVAESSREVALALPAMPSYHSATMALSVEIDRGDVWHDPTPRVRGAVRRPALIVYTTDGGRRIPLARWPTTIGGWRDHRRAGGAVEKHWEDSPVGHRVWRDLYVAPTWLPPDTTPDRDLVRAVDDHVVLAREVLGPSYRAAFGLVAFPHVGAGEGGEPDLESRRVLTHGSGDLTSIADGDSHGCHRLLGMHAVRLADFVLAHQIVIRRGDEPTRYRRIVRHGGRFPVAIDSLGYRIELGSPISVDVLPGRVHEP